MQAYHYEYIPEVDLLVVVLVAGMHADGFRSRVDGRGERVQHTA